MSGNITEHVEIKIENDCDPLHLPIQIKLEEENCLNVRKDLFAISTYEDLGIKEEPPVLGLEPDFPAFHQVDETTSDNASKSEHDGHSSQSTVEIVQSIECPKLPCTMYRTLGYLEVIDHKNVVRYKMKCLGCGFTTTNQFQIDNHVSIASKVKCQLCHEEISEERFALHSQTCSSDMKNHPQVNSCSEKNKETELENTCNKNKEIETEVMNNDLQVVRKKRAYKKRKTSTTLSSVKPKKYTQPSLQIEQVCNYNLTPNFTNPPSSVLICTSFEKIGSVVTIDNEETFKFINKCTSCGFKTEKASEMLEHIKKSKTLKTSLKCPYCDTQFNTIIRLKSHLYNIHNIDVGKNVNLEIKSPIYKETLCQICNPQLNNIESLYQHYQQNTLNSRDISNDCFVCAKQFDDITALKSHLLKIHNITDTVPHCLTCGYKCTLRRGLLRHLKVKHKSSGNQYKCTLCNARYI